MLKGTQLRGLRGSITVKGDDDFRGGTAEESGLQSRVNRGLAEYDAGLETHQQEGYEKFILHV
ncbi:MAG: hypothetical protein NVSMB30_16810 [Hymenobacter sp.]